MAHDDAVVHEHLGDTYLKLGRTAEALEAWQKARSLDPKNKNLAEKIENAKPKMGQRESPGGSPSH
jgi:predicted negative regulator of RcsB-dependent stress response